MSEQVSMYLDRARRAARAQSLGAVTRGQGRCVEALARTLQRIHLERGMDCEVDCPAGLKFRGERQDLEEMLGNLLDNACKWASEADRCRGRRCAARSRRPSLAFEMKVGDDGPGLPEDKREEALKRGRRLDETKPGSGPRPQRS